MLKIDEITVRYGRIAALRGISMHIDEGEIVALVGPNGAGKSTTINSIAGIVRPSAGSIEFDGKPVIGASPERLSARGLALVPEGRGIFGTLTVAENLRIGATSRSDKSTLDADMERILTRFPVLKGYYKSQADRLSGGEQQQLALGRALLSKPRLMLLDEPSFGLAPKMIDLVFETLSELKRDGTTVLLVEQAAARAVAFADRSYVLNTGEIVHSGTSKELLEKDLAELYLGVTT